MPSIERTFTVDVAPSAVLEYLQDFSHAEAWDPGTETCTRQDEGPVVVGSTWHNVSKIAGIGTELTYRLAERSADHLVFVGENDTATSTDTITVRPAGTGSELTYHANIEMHGLAKLASPAIKLVFEKIGNDTERQLAAVLNELAA
ncbi:Carbon monoxide dehydrogenase subunit G [Frankineae bacterium MT45]|nr:Carbon monoxide dehydrogenase subunit G [Frankineae bacterium MT45]